MDSVFTDPLERPTQGLIKSFKIAMEPRWPANLTGNSRKQSEERRHSGAHPPPTGAKGQLMHMRCGPSQKAFPLAVWRSRGQAGGICISPYAAHS